MNTQHVTDGVGLTYNYAVVQVSARRYQLIRSCTRQGTVPIFETVGKPVADYLGLVREARTANEVRVR